MQEQTSSQVAAENPFLKQDNPYEEYEKKQQEAFKLKQNQEILKVQLLAWKLFDQNPDGVEFYKYLEEKFLHGTIYNPYAQNPNEVLQYWEGFRECIKHFKGLVNQHKSLMESLVGNEEQPESGALAEVFLKVAEEVRNHGSRIY